MQVLQEMYFGKVIALQQLEDTINQIRIKYEKDADFSDAIYRKINRDPLIFKMAKYIKEQFGFGEVIVTVNKDRKFRASTLSFLADKNGIAYVDDAVSGVDIKDALIVTREGIRYDNTKFSPNILILISMGFLFSKVVSSAELVAALLHEIGHSFSKAALGSSQFNGRIDESFADKFATMYGYGPELNSVLSKFSMKGIDDSSIQSIPIVNVFAGLKMISQSVIGRVLGDNPHPTVNKRMQETIKQMEYDLKKAENLTPKQKKDLSDSIERAKASMDQFYNDSPRAADTVYKFYMKNVESDLPMERSRDEHVDTYGNSEIIDRKLFSLYSGKR